MQALPYGLVRFSTFTLWTWGVADAFDDFLSEEIQLEIFTKKIERDGAFVAGEFFPADAISMEEMQEIIALFLERSRRQ